MESQKPQERADDAKNRDERPPLKRRRQKPPEAEPASSSSKPGDPKFGNVIDIGDKFKKYGFWQAREGPLQDNPKALILFAGRSRPGDLSHCLARLGWVVCSVDTKSPKPTDVLEGTVWEVISGDIEAGYFEAVWIATPCGTFSPLRENPPGPRPLRSIQAIEGLPKDQLTDAEFKQVEEANELVKVSYIAAAYQNRAKKPWGIENPRHHPDKPQIWYMPLFKKLAELRGVQIVEFDQCRTNLPTTKPTRFMVKRLDFNSLDRKRCNHPKTEHKRPDGSTYMSAHGSTVQKWVDGPKGRERASVSQGGIYRGPVRHHRHGVPRHGRRGLAGEGAPSGAPLRRPPLIPLVASFLSPTDRERQNRLALGGMRNPAKSILRMPKVRNPAWQVRELLYKAQSLWPELTQAADAILSGDVPQEPSPEIVAAVRKTLIQMLGGSIEQRTRTARATTPIQASVIEAWGQAVGDPDSGTLARWLDHGAPLGFSQRIETTGIFPIIEDISGGTEEIHSIVRPLTNWENYKSAVEEREDLNQLIEDYTARGFCHKVKTMEEAKAELGREPILNRLGVVVKFSASGKKKSRIIWDLRESKANSFCHPAERVLLPKLLDVAESALRSHRKGAQVWLAAVDIRDAFMNVPAGDDKYMTVASKEDGKGNQELIIFDVLVFGSGSSPTIWGRYAAWLGRSSAAISPSSGIQIYVDDPSVVMEGPKSDAIRELTNILLWFNIAGFPVKLEKAEGGKKISWVGATIEASDQQREVTITIPKDKVEKLQATTQEFLRRPVAGHKQIRSYAGSLSFIAGLIPHLRPFLASLWAVLSVGKSMNDGAGTRRSGKLIHTRRIRPALRWMEALLRGSPAPLARTLSAFYSDIKATITTDASPWGIGGVLKINDKAVECFSSPIPQGVLEKFKAQTGNSKFNTLWEGLALLVAFRLWLQKLEYGAQVRARSDNMGVLYTIVGGRAKSADLNVLAREFSLDQALRLYRISWLSHILGVTNLEADALSRRFAPVPAEWPESLVGVPLVPVRINEDFWRIQEHNL